MKRILLVDDDKQEFMLVNFLLKDRYQESFRLDYAATIEEAHTCLSERRVDVILLDDKLASGMTSAQTIPLLQKKAFNVPIIIISKDINSRQLKDRVRLGMNKVVDKFDLKKELADGLLD